MKKLFAFVLSVFVGTGVAFAQASNAQTQQGNKPGASHPPTSRPTTGKSNQLNPQPLPPVTQPSVNTRVPDLGRKAGGEKESFRTTSSDRRATTGSNVDLNPQPLPPIVHDPEATTSAHGKNKRAARAGASRAPK